MAAQPHQPIDVGASRLESVEPTSTSLRANTPATAGLGVQAAGGRDARAPRLTIPSQAGQARQPGLVFYALIFAAAWAVYAAVAWPHTHPPYMDSFYYVDIARNLARGRGLSEGFVWNYLAGMPPLHHPSSAYWLPGLSLLLAPVYILGAGYHGAALLTAGCAALCVALAARMAYDVLSTRRHALIAAGLTLFNGIWFHDWSTPDAFVLFAALATLTFMLAARGLQGQRLSFALAGLTAGLAALTRQEGVFLVVALSLAALLTPGARRTRWTRGVLGAIGLYALTQFPWWLHNVATTGAPLAMGGGRTLWMRSYDAFYYLHTEALSARAYLAWGLANIAHAKLGAAALTLEVWSAQWLVVLIPPLLVGIWRLRGRVEYRTFLIYWAMLALALPLLFTATLEHGTLAHASAALLPFGSVAVVAGLDAICAALTRWRGHSGARLAREMGIIAVGLAAIVSLGMTVRTFPAHGDEYARDLHVIAWLHRHNPGRAPVMVLDPPAFAYIADRAYVVAPSDSLDAALTVARHYGVAYWALDPIHAPSQAALYDDRVHLPWLRLAATVDGVRLFRIITATHWGTAPSPQTG